MFSVPLGVGATIVLVAFVAEYIDSSIGMGYGTSLTPILLVMGFSPLQVVPAVLLSELVSGIFAGLLHHSSGNVDFRFRRIALARIPQKLQKWGLVQTVQRGFSLHLRIVIVLASCSIAGTIAAVLFALSIPSYYLKLYISCLILAVGSATLITLRSNFSFSWKKISTLGVIAAFNKGISGGGYGPVVTSGQLLAGVDAKNAVAHTSLSEGLTCLLGVLLYFFSPLRVDWKLSPYLLAGAVCSVPFSVYTVKKINTRNLRVIVGVFTMGVAAVSLAQLLL
jgi:uncharacterized membrane protein YfcA